MFSFGYSCDDIIRPSLKGLAFSISLYDQSNETQCIPMPNTYLHNFCSTLIGDPNAISINKWTSFYKPNEAFIFKIFFQDSQSICYKHFYQFLCRAALPQCDPVKNQIVHPCKEMC